MSENQNEVNMVQKEGDINPTVGEITGTGVKVSSPETTLTAEFKTRPANGFTPKSAERILKAVKKTQGSFLPAQVLMNIDLGVHAAVRGEMRQMELTFQQHDKKVRLITVPRDFGDVFEAEDGQKFRIIVVPDNSNEPIKPKSNLILPKGM